MLSFYETNSHYPFRHPRTEPDAVFLLNKCANCQNILPKLYIYITIFPCLRGSGSSHPGRRKAIERNCLKVELVFPEMQRRWEVFYATVHTEVV